MKIYNNATARNIHIHVHEVQFNDPVITHRNKERNEIKNQETFTSQIPS